MEGTHIGAVHGGLSPWEGPHAGAEAECEESSPEEDGATETTCELARTPIPHPPALLKGRKERKIGNEVEKGRGGGKVF